MTGDKLQHLAFPYIDCLRTDHSSSRPQIPRYITAISAQSSLLDLTLICSMYESHRIYLNVETAGHDQPLCGNQNMNWECRSV